jgi:hypothetical protein
MKITVLALFVLTFSPSVTRAQTETPVIQNCSKKCSGDWSITNQGIVPLWVTLEPRSLTYENGAPRLNPLDSSITLTLSRTSVRIPPKGDYRFSYKLACQTYPCAVEIFATMVVGKTPDGIQIKLSLPEVVYFCQNGKSDDCRSTFRKLNNVAD